MNIPIRGMADGAILPEGYHQTLSNVRRDPEGYWRELEGVVWIDSLGPEPVIGLYEFTRRGAQRWLVYERGDGDESVVAWYDWRSPGVESTIEFIARRPRTAAADVGSTFLSISGQLYIFTAGARPIRWDGWRAVPVGWQGTPPAPGVAGSDQGFDHFDAAGADYGTTAGNADDVLRNATTQRGVGLYADTANVPWRHGYAVTYLSNLGMESPPSAIVYASGTNSAVDRFGRRVVRVEVPPGPPEAVAARVWRTPDLASLTTELAAPTLYLVHESPHAGGFSWIDHTPDGELAIELAVDQLGEVPLNAYAAAWFDGRLWCVGEDDPTRLRASERILHEQFPLEQAYQIGTSATGPIVSCVSYAGGLYVFKRGGVYVVRDGAVRTLSERHQVSAPQGAVAVPGVGVLFLDDLAGPCVIVGTDDDAQPMIVQPIGGIRRTWRRYVGSEQYSARVLYDPELQEVWWSVCEGGSSRPTLGLVYHLPTEAWSIRPDWQVDALARVGGRVLVGCSDPGLASPYGIGVLSRAVQTRPGETDPIAAELVTAWQEFPTQLQARTVELVLDALGEPSVELYLRVDHKPTRVHQTERGRQQVQTNARGPLWGVDLWDVGTWADVEPGRVPVDLHGETKAFAFELTLRSARMRLHGLRLIVPGEPAAPGYRSERSRGALP